MATHSAPEQPFPSRPVDAATLDCPPSRLPLATVAGRCREETESFLRREPSDERYCRELLRRALCERDEAARAVTLAQYRPLVLGWLRHHPARAGAGESDAFWLNRVFERFWQQIGPAEFAAFPHLAALLRYLKLCVHGVLVDAARARQARQLTPEGERARRASEDAGQTGVLAAMTGEALWTAVEAEARARPEMLVARGCFVQALPPRAVYARHPEAFASVQDVHRVKRNLIDRLRRSAAIRAFVTAQ